MIVSFRHITVNILISLSLLFLSITSAFATTAGFGNDIIYTIMIDRYFNANHDNDIPQFAFPSDSDYDRSNRYWLYKMHYRNASGNPSDVTIDAYWGGDLQGVVDKLDYLHKLGVTVVVLSPVFENVNGYTYTLGGTGYHGYWTKDFMRLEEHFINPPIPGETLDDVMSKGVLLKGLIQKAHSYDPPLKIVLDIALNHTSPAPIDTTVFDDTNYLEMGALYDDGEFVARPCSPEGSKSCQETYVGEGWFHPPSSWVEWNDPSTLYSGYLNGNLADLDQKSPAVRSYLLRALRKWLALGVDGFRFDNVKNIYPNYLTDLHRQLVTDKPDIIILSEYFDAGIFENGLTPGKVPRSIEWLKSQPYSTFFNFSFATSAREYFTGKMDNLGVPYVLRHILDVDSPQNPLKERSNSLVNFINNHDMPRMLSLENSNPERYAAALKLLFISPGIPKLMYGDEIGLAYFDNDELWDTQNRHAPEWSRLFMPWEKFDDPFAQYFYSLTRSLISVRKIRPYLTDGPMEFLQATNIFNFLGGNSYVAIQRTGMDSDKGDTVLFLYSARQRAFMEFEVNLPDGHYRGIHDSGDVEVRGGVLKWKNISADDSIVIVSSNSTRSGR